jgi:ADP-ribose pyrophosphatase YjhB (NUDIX family)
MNKLKQYLIAEINDIDFGKVSSTKKNNDNYFFRRASRGVLIKGDKIAIMNVCNKNYHKLPGGGIEKNENNEIAFKREIREETGYNCKLLKNIHQNSIVLEKREKDKFIQISYIFFAKVVGKPKKTELMEDEINDGFKLEWYSLSKAIKLFQGDKNKDYKTKFVQKRDIAILNFYKIISNKNIKSNNT